MSSRIILNGLRAIEECLQYNPERIARLMLPPPAKSNPRIERIRELAHEKKVRIEITPKPNPDEPVLAMMKDYQYADFDQFCDELKIEISNGHMPVVLALDGLNDPHNLGAILRTAAFMGVRGVVLPKDRSVAITDTVYRIASGGIEHLCISQVTNMVQALDALKEVGFWTVAFSEHAEKKTTDLSVDFPAVIVVGSEEKGVRPLVLQNCDHVVALSSRGALISLNASVAASLAMAWATKLQ